jgi:hypothetical protein
MRFAIAGIQMRVSATEDNVATMRHRLATENGIVKHRTQQERRPR